MYSSDKEKFSLELTKALGLNKLAAEASEQLIEAAFKKIADEKSDRNVFQEALNSATDEELKLYIPDVYQKDIYKINYIKLKEDGINFISFDIDDTITDTFINKVGGKINKLSMPEDAKELFKKLKLMGFTVTLLTNAGADIAKVVNSQLNADGYISRANKPETMNFELLQKQYGVEKSQMAHIGNNIRTDVLGGNQFGITTCLVRECGFSMKIVKFFGKRIGLPTKGHLIREKLLERNLWRKHHLKVKGDQYYQLGEIPAYRK